MCGCGDLCLSISRTLRQTLQMLSVSWVSTRSTEVKESFSGTIPQSAYRTLVLRLRWIFTVGPSRSNLDSVIGSKSTSLAASILQWIPPIALHRPVKHDNTDDDLRLVGALEHLRGLFGSFKPA